MGDDSIRLNTSTSAGAYVDTRTNTGGEHRQVIVIGEGAATSDAVIPGDATNGLLVNPSDRSARQLGYVSLNSAGTVSITVSSSGSTVAAAQYGTWSTTVNQGSTAVSATNPLWVSINSTGSLTVTQSGSGQAVSFNSQQGSGTSTGAMRVELPTDGTGKVGLNSGFNWIGTVALASGTSVTTGAGVQAVTFNSALGSGTAAAAMRVELPTDGTGKVGLNNGFNWIGTVALASGTSVTTGAGVQAVTFNSALGSGTAAAAMRVELPTDGTGKVGLNAGTNSIGSVTINSAGTIGTDVYQGGVAVSVSNPLFVSNQLYTEDFSAPADPVGTNLNLVRADTPAAITDGDGDNISARGTNRGELYVKHLDSIALASAGTLAVTISSSGSTVAAAQYGTWTVTTTGSGVQAVTFNSALGSGTAAAAMRVELPTDGTGKVGLNAGFNWIGTVALASGTSVSTSAGVQAVTFNSALGSGTAAAAMRVELPTDGTGVVGLNSGTKWIGTVALASGGSISLFSAGSIAVSGDVASAATDSGNPVKVGGKYNSTLPALTTGQRGDIQVTSNATIAATVVPIATGYGWTSVMHDGLMASSIVTVASRLAPIAIGGYYIYNPNTAVAYVQCFNTNGTVTLGSHTPVLSMGIPPVSAANLALGACPIDFSLGLKIAATTTASNSTAPTLGLTTNWFYR